jgi:DNA-binding transcriptional regulator YdaS (Cro superfamily)
MHAMTPIERAIEKAGGLTELARRLGVATPQVVSNWRGRGSVPPEYCIPIEEATERAVTRHELRPDVFGDPPGKTGRKKATV